MKVPITVADVIFVVSRFYGLPEEEITGAKRHQSLARARAIAMYLARHHTILSYQELGLKFRKHHTTVLNAVGKIADQIRASDYGLKGQIAELEYLLDAKSRALKVEAV